MNQNYNVKNNKSDSTDQNQAMINDIRKIGQKIKKLRQSVIGK